MPPPNLNPRSKVVIPKLVLPPPAHTTESDMTSSNSNQNAEDATSTQEPTPTPQATTSNTGSSSSNEHAENAMPTLEPASIPQNVTSEPSPTLQNITFQPVQFFSSAQTLSRATLARIARENIICLPQIVDKVPRLDIDSSEVRSDRCPVNCTTHPSPESSLLMMQANRTSQLISGFADSSLPI
jgi:hypothetical protein